MEDPKQKQRQLEKFKQKIKKDLQTHPIENQRVSYSVVEKKSGTGISKNVRVLFFIHGKFIAYSKEFDKNVKIPFEKMDDLPKFKVQFTQEQIAKVDSKVKTLTINFKKNKEVWEMMCSSAELARNWAKTIKTSMEYSKQQANNTPQHIVIPPSDPSSVNRQQQNNFPAKEEEPPNRPSQSEEKPTNLNIVEQPQPLQRQENQIKKQIKIEQVKPNQEIVTDQRELQLYPSNTESEIKNNTEKTEEKSPFNFFDISSPTKKTIKKPQSTLYVGSVAVDNEDDQQKLKERIEIFSKMNQRMKGEYEQKREEEKIMKEEIRNQNDPLSNIFAFSTNVKLQIEKMRKEWGYEFAKGQNQYDITYDFKIYSQLVTTKIIDELGLHEKKRYYQPIQETSSSLKYEINGVLFEIFLNQLKEITGFQEKGTIVSKQSSKMALNEFKNFNYILSLTHNKGKIRIPLSVVIQYKGFVVFAKVIVPAAEAYENMDALQRQLEILEAESRINTSVFQDPECAKIVALQSKAYQKLARAQNLPNKKFDFCYIESLNHFLPNDYNNFSKDKPYEKLRPELIQDDEFQEQILYGEDMCALSNRLKLPQNYTDGMQQLRIISKFIPERIDLLVNSLENLQATFCNSRELSNLMHEYGINIRYLGAVLQKINISWMKQIIMSEICSRCAKNFLNFDLQDCLLNLSESSAESVRNFQIKQIINFLNKMFGKNQQTQIFWKQINRQAQSYFKVSINRDEINEGFLLQSLQSHCNFSLKGVDQSLNLLNSATPFGVNNFASFQVKPKVYDLGFTELYKSIHNLLNEPCDESYEQLRILLNLNRAQNIAPHFKMSDTYDKIIKFLVNWLPPAQAYDLYYPQEIQFGEILPSSSLYEIKLAEIRWGLKNKQIEESERIKEWMVDHISKWIGQAHPILTQLYELFANYHLLFKDQEKKAVNYSKSAIKNQQKVVGPNNEKMADCYYLLGTIYMNHGKKIEAVNTLKKAYEIIVKSENEDSEACGEVCLKLGQLSLALNTIQAAIDLGLKAIKILGNNQKQDSEIRAIQLVCRCYQLNEDWESYMQLIEEYLVNRVVQFIDRVELTERIIKVIILPSFRTIAYHNSIISQKIVKILDELPETTRAPNMAYNFLRTRIEQKIFPHKFLQVLSDIEQVIQQIENNGMLTRWKGFENLSNKSLLNKVGVNMQNKGFYFIASLEATSIFIGSSYIYGILSDS